MSSSSKRRTLQTRFLVAAVSLLAIATIVLFARQQNSSPQIPPGLQAEFVGRSQCSQCHPNQVALFTNSHHDLAMDLATPQTVLADFENVEVEHLGVPTRFFRRENRYFVHTEGPDGQLTDFPIQYVFGVDPLQQYMVEFDRDDRHAPGQLARLQVLRWSWDTTLKKWFHLDPPDVHDRILPDDPLHWTGSSQRWNSMCADCHSTNLVKGYDRNHQRYATTFSEIDVSCEACHGPASLHIAIYANGNQRQHPTYGSGLADLKSSPAAQLNSCAPCHSRRSLVQSDFQPHRDFHDHFALSWLQPNLYHADGQIKDEVYEYGSFLQSKMFHRGIRCSDCHDPHTTRLKANGNQVCTSCHQHPAPKYDSPAHHFHAAGKPGSQCVDCHMPVTHYMQVDGRHDHSLRIPRPDLSLLNNTPNACAACHVNPQNLPDSLSHLRYADWLLAAEQGNTTVQTELQRANQWCDEACNRWYGPTRHTEPHFGSAMTLALRRTPDAAESLESWLRKRGVEAPDGARAAMLEQLSLLDPNRAANVARSLNPDDNPVVRRAAADTFQHIASSDRSLRALQPFLSDPHISVRAQAGHTLLSLDPATLASIDPADRDLALAALRTSLRANDDQAAALLGIGLLNERLGLLPAAIEAYELAIQTDPHAAGPRSNLAALLDDLADRSLNRDPNQSSQLRQRSTQLRAEELPLLQRDAKLLPNASQLHYRLGMALYLHGDSEGALAALRQALSLQPDDRTYRLGLILLLEKQGRLPEASQLCQEYLNLHPQDDEFRRILQSLTTANQ